jgi:hypothetical protein
MILISMLLSSGLAFAGIRDSCHWTDRDARSFAIAEPSLT